MIEKQPTELDHAYGYDTEYFPKNTTLPTRARSMWLNFRFDAYMNDSTAIEARSERANKFLEWCTKQSWFYSYSKTKHNGSYDSIFLNFPEQFGTGETFEFYFGLYIAMYGYVFFEDRFAKRIWEKFLPDQEWPFGEDS